MKNKNIPLDLKAKICLDGFQEHYIRNMEQEIY